MMKKIVSILFIALMLITTIFAVTTSAAEVLIDSSYTDFYMGSNQVRLTGEAFYDSTTGQVHGKTTLSALGTPSGSVSASIWSFAEIHFIEPRLPNVELGDIKNVTLTSSHTFDYVDIYFDLPSTTDYVTIYHRTQYGNNTPVSVFTYIYGTDVNEVETNYLSGIDF